ncbi:venom acid phosphatase Acph-1-like [Achroia grisella]|uniref:venom acid phosphatase Acph-1-like n=1 Tax=Achroia grisella TaxID=688607 RepID=UPI0027D34FBC|nr:venom acid phosphatase Acph-1-like [Achroia grisella]
MRRLIVSLVIVVATWGEDATLGRVVEPSNSLDRNDGLGDTELILAFVVFRHGDRTPDLEEMALYSHGDNYKDVFFPYGMKALTNKGKQRGYLIGEYLRRRYDGLISRIYLPDEIMIRTTEYARTKMTALTALTAMYPPLPAQRWNPALDWQPIPYDTLGASVDDLLYWYYCPRYLWLRNQVYNFPEVKKWLKPYQKLFTYLTENAGRNITTPEDVFFIDNLFQALENVGIKTPKWAQDVMPEIKEMTKIEYAIEFYNTELTKLATGVLMADILNATNAAIEGNMEQYKLRLYSGHENNVAAIMAAVNVFTPHQPNYGATFSLELRKHRSTGQYGIAAVYAKDAGGPEAVLPIAGCGGSTLCDYETFVNLTSGVVWNFKEYEAQCVVLGQ